MGMLLSPFLILNVGTPALPTLYLSQADGLTTPTPLHFPTPHLHALPIHQATSPFKREDSP